MNKFGFPTFRVFLISVHGSGRIFNRLPASASHHLTDSLFVSNGLLVPIHAFEWRDYTQVIPNRQEKKEDRALDKTRSA
jgi:hypothetical protein